MNISYNWLRDLIDLDMTAEETAAELTRIGNAVDAIHTAGEDHVFDIDLTSNRPDCLSHRGIARELSASTGRSIKGPVRAERNDVPMPSILAHDIVNIEAPDLCNRFTARIIRGVKVGPSPEWLVKRLEAVGERSINNIADITNYVMLELGQPMHAFDLDRLVEKRIIVRRARLGETIVTLDDVERQLDETSLFICDAEKPVAIGGIMGGLDSSITENTVDVLIEVAYFNRSNIRSTSRRLHLSTEASYRFERGVDINALKEASDRALQLIEELAGGTAGEFIDAYPVTHRETVIASSDISAAVERLSGITIAEDQCTDILSALKIEANETASEFTVPSWRHDLAIEADLVEEIVRFFGYEHISDEIPPAYSAGEYLPHETRLRHLRQNLTDSGFSEAMSYSFVDAANDDLYEPAGQDLRNYVTLRDAIIDGSTRMRPTIVPGLLNAIRHNLNFQRRDLRFFEIGKVFSVGEDPSALPQEDRVLTIAMTGVLPATGKQHAKQETDLYDVKGVVENVLETLGHLDPEFRLSDARHLTAGQRSNIYCKGRYIGSLGRINSDIMAAYKFKKPVFVAELLLDHILDLPEEPVIYSPLPRFPAVSRDVSITVLRAVTLAEILRAANDSPTDILEDVRFIDVYESDDVRTITIRVTYRANERTLTEDEVETVHKGIVDKLKNSFGLQKGES